MNYLKLSVCLLCFLLLVACHANVKQHDSDSFIKKYYLNNLSKIEGFQYIHQDIAINEILVPSSYFIDCVDNHLIMRELVPFLGSPSSAYPLPCVEVYDANNLIISTMKAYPKSYNYTNLGNPKLIVPMTEDIDQTILDKEYFIIKAEFQIPDGVYYLRIGTSPKHTNNYVAYYTIPYSDLNFKKTFLLGDIDTDCTKITIKNGKITQPFWNISFLVSQNDKYKFIIRNEFDNEDKAKEYFSQLNDLIISTVSFIKEKYKLKESQDKVIIVGKPILYIQTNPDLMNYARELAFTMSCLNDDSTKMKIIFYDSDDIDILLSELFNAFFKYSESAMLGEGMVHYFSEQKKKINYTLKKLNDFKEFTEKYLDKTSKQYYGLEKFLYLQGWEHANMIFGNNFVYKYFNVPTYIVRYIIEKYGYNSFIKFYYSLDPKDLGADSFNEIERDMVMLFENK